MAPSDLRTTFKKVRIFSFLLRIGTINNTLLKAISKPFQGSSPLWPVALLPMVILLAIVVVFVYISFHTGVIGTDDAEFSYDNYKDLFGDEFVLEVLENTLIFLR